MKKEFLQTPAILLDLDAFEKNINVYQEAAAKHGKQIWPMIKTHKSTEAVKMQYAAGSRGFLCGTLDECEAVAKANLDGVTIMFAYPVASAESIARVIALTKKSDFIIRLDNLDGAKMISEAAIKAGVKVGYTIILDSGLHRFGIKADKIVAFADSLKGLDGLKFRGISTHPGHVYGAKNHEEVLACTVDEKTNVKLAVDALKGAGYELEYVTSGSTPTFFSALDDEYINVYHPGNYVFNDCIQMSTNTATEAECSLTVIATVISHPSEDLYICDAGAKCLGLDQGAHGNDSIKGHGIVKGHPELVIYSLSEEVGKFHVEGKTDLKVGDKVEMIPNHSCSTANLTNYFICCRGDEVVGTMNVDFRGNSTPKNV